MITGNEQVQRNVETTNRSWSLVSCPISLLFNSEIGRNAPWSDAHLQRCMVVEDGDSQSLLRCKLAGSYDWARLEQRAFNLLDDSPANKQIPTNGSRHTS